MLATNLCTYFMQVLYFYTILGIKFNNLCRITLIFEKVMCSNLFCPRRLIELVVGSLFYYFNLFFGRENQVKTKMV